MKRRSFLMACAAGAGATLLLRPDDKGRNHNEYFQQLSHALNRKQQAMPRLVIDRERLLKNVETLRTHIGDRYHYRVVAKSLPSLGLIAEVMQAANTNRLMLFHQPFINAVLDQFPDADILLGKPMPVSAAKTCLSTLSNRNADIKWLVDTPERLQQYAELATELQHDLQISIEIDVGLHRGGVNNTSTLQDMVKVIRDHARLRFSGLMGYEPHIVKVPGDPIGYRDDAMAVYGDCVRAAKQTLGGDFPANVVLNAGGSPTYQMYDDGDWPFNELAAGSCLVKPSDFDLDTLADHQAASFIAAPVLKREDETRIPGINLGGLQSLWNPNRARSFFLYGGYWKAQPVSPEGLINNPLFGRSTNQEMLNGSSSLDLDVDDWVFMRPTQSEFVFLQFGDIQVFEQGQLRHSWPVIPQA